MVQETWDTKEAALKTRILTLKPKFEELFRDPSSIIDRELIVRPIRGAGWYTGLKGQMKEFKESERKLMGKIEHFETNIRLFYEYSAQDQVCLCISQVLFVCKHSPLLVLHAENRKPLALYLSITVMTGTKQPRFALR